MSFPLLAMLTNVVGAVVAPHNLVATAVSNNQIDLTWDHASPGDVDHYNVYRDGGATPIAQPTTNSYSDMNLDPETQYTYTVSAVDLAGNESAESASDSATTSAVGEGPSIPQNLAATAVSSSRIDLTWDASTDNGGGNGDTEAPTVPQNLVATAVSSSRIDLTWDASTDNVGVEFYKVYRDGAAPEIGTPTTNSFSDTSFLEAGTTYSYEVSAVDAAGNESALSAPDSATTWAPTDFPGLTGWWSAQDLSGQSDGTDVTSWADKSGNNRDWGSDGTRTLPDKETASGFDAVEFDDTGPEAMQLSGVSLGTLLGNAGLVAIVFEVGDTPSTSSNDYWQNETAFADAEGFWSLSVRNDGGGGTEVMAAIWDGAAKTIVVGTESGARHVFLMRRDSGGTLYVSFDGGIEQTVASGVPEDDTGDMYLGGQAPTNAPEFDGFHYEIVTSTSNGTAQDRADLIAYLKNEWNIA